MAETTRTLITDSRTWVDDGHEIAVTTDFGHPEAGVYCPHARKDWASVAWADRPPCRRATREDGAPDETWDGGACLFDEYLTDGRVDDAAPSPLVSRRVAFAWSGCDGETVNVRPDNERARWVAEALEATAVAIAEQCGHKDYRQRGQGDTFEERWAEPKIWPAEHCPFCSKETALVRTLAAEYRDGTR